MNPPRPGTRRKTVISKSRKAVRSQFWGLVVLGTAPLLASAQVQEHWYDYWFVRLEGRALFNVKASVDRTPPSVQQGIYDDGFVLPDIGGSASGKTWNWGYENSAQISGDQLVLKRLRDLPSAGVFKDENNDPSFGGEILVGARFFEFEIHGRPARIGIEVGYGYHNFTFDHSSTASGTARLETDSFNLNGITPPMPPYAGTSAGPGPLIDLNPASRVLVSSPSEAFFDGELESDLHNFKFGVWLDYQLTEKAVASGSLGYHSIYADTQLEYVEGFNFDDPAIPDIPATQKTAGGRDWNSGVYFQVRMRYDFTSWFGAYAGAQISYNEEFAYRADDRKVTLNFDTLFATSLGVVFRF
ncbi:MAG: hypothetical protein L0Y58_12145 [Verrucomicrobia subdivision 3 bacterium]|nr:hypothetical protein [Limisphaerales bacterium]